MGEEQHRPRCLALFSGGLNALLAVRLIERFAVSIEPVWVRTPCKARETEVRAACKLLNLPLTVLEPPDDFADVLRTPVRSGASSSPCRDCRVAIFRAARRYADTSGADFAISGEVLGQDLRLQRRRDLDMLAIAAGWEDRLVRPLSARRLDETLPERRGWLDRTQLLDLHGQSRRPQHALAQEWNLDPTCAAPSTCALTDAFLHEQVQRALTLPDFSPWLVALLRSGRCEWLDEQTLVVISRRESEGQQLAELFHRPDKPAGCRFVELVDVPGPSAIVVGRSTIEQLATAQSLVAGRAKVGVNDVRWRITP